MVVVVVVGASVVLVGIKVVVGASVVLVGMEVVVVGARKPPVSDAQMRKPAPASARTQKRVTTMMNLRDLRGIPLVPG